MVEIVLSWRSRLDFLIENGRAVYLPFSIDEETIEAFEAELRGSQVRLRVVRLDGIGYVHGHDPLMEAINRDRPVVFSRQSEFLTCDKASLLTALDVLSSEYEQHTTR
jgi:hypothetical protein